MASGETIIKFTDYPFAYSIVGILSTMIGFSLNQNQIIFLGVAGAFGTFLTIIDPVGHLIKLRAKEIIKKSTNQTKNLSKVVKIQYKLSSLKSRAITYEIEKIIGLFYFVVIIILFLIAIILPTPFFDKLIIYNNTGEPLCEKLCFKFIYLSISAGALTVLAIRANQFWKELDNKINIAGFHQIAIDNEFATVNSVENMTRSIEQNDWEIAKLWYNKIEEEIKYKKAKREIIIKASDLVYSPLHGEAIEFTKTLKSIPFTRRYPSFNHQEWDKIKQYSYQSIIEDDELRRRIDSFYKLMYDYNEQLGSVGSLVDDIIKKHASQVYEKSVTGIDYDVDSPKGNGNADLIGCALFDVHPLEFYRVKGNLKEITIRFKKNNVGENATFRDTKLFDQMWEQVIDDVKQNNEVQKLKKMFSQLEIENPKLMKIYSDKVGMQWKA